MASAIVRMSGVKLNGLNSPSFDFSFKWYWTKGAIQENMNIVNAESPPTKRNVAKMTNMMFSIVNSAVPAATSLEKSPAKRLPNENRRNA